MTIKVTGAKVLISQKWCKREKTTEGRSIWPTSSSNSDDLQGHSSIASLSNEIFRKVVQ